MNTCQYIINGKISIITKCSFYDTILNCPISSLDSLMDIFNANYHEDTATSIKQVHSVY